jgi:hypothetical protein
MMDALYTFLELAGLFASMIAFYVALYWAIRSWGQGRDPE